MQAGFAEVNMTPPLDMQIPGYGTKRRASSGIKDELYAKAMVVESEGTKLAFIVLDMISLDLEPAQHIRERVHALTGIPPEHVMISCTHTHTGAPRQEGPAENAFYSTLESKAADAAIIAHSRLQDVRIGTGRGQEHTIAFNRRFFMKDGSVTTNPGIRNPDIDRAAGPIDPEVLVIRIDDMDGQPIAVVSNYACHTDTVGGTEYSGDFPAFLSETIKKQYGNHVVSLFFQGACGNINHHDVSGNTDTTTVPHRKRMGDILGLEVARVRNSTKSAPAAPKLATKSRLVNSSERYPYDREIAWAEKYLETFKDKTEAECTSGQWMSKGRAERILASLGKPSPTRDYEIQVSVVGDIAVVALPAEIFVEFGLEIKQKSPYPFTIINELANGSGNGYVCTAEACSQGGYEPSARHFDEKSGEHFVEAALALLHELHAENA